MFSIRKAPICISYRNCSWLPGWMGFSLTEVEVKCFRSSVASKEAACNVEKGQRGTQSLVPAFLTKVPWKSLPFPLPFPADGSSEWAQECHNDTFFLTQCSVLPFNSEFWQHSVLKEAHSSFNFCPGDGSCRPYLSLWREYKTFLTLKWLGCVSGLN